MLSWFSLQSGPSCGVRTVPADSAATVIYRRYVPDREGCQDNQVITVAQQAGDRATPYFLHGVLLIEDIAPDTVFNIKPAAGDGGVNVGDAD